MEKLITESILAYFCSLEPKRSEELLTFDFCLSRSGITLKIELYYFGI